MNEMSVLKYPEACQAEIIKKACPEIGDNQILTKSIVSNVSAGTEMSFYRGTAPQFNSAADAAGLWHDAPDCLAFPMQSDDPGCWWMGYSSISRVVKVGCHVTAFREGDLVFSWDTHKSMHILNESDCFHLPPEANPESASFLMLTAICFNAMLDSDIKLTDNVVVIGMGTVGQLIAQMAKLAGANVAAVDFIDARLALAKRLGADYTINPRHDGDMAQKVHALFGQGADCVFEASGNSLALPDAVRSARKDGQVTLVSFYQKPPATFEMGREFHHNRITIRSSQIGGINPQERAKYDIGRRLRSSLELIQKMQMEPLISHRCEFGDYPELLKVLAEAPEKAQSVIIKYLD